MHYIWIIWAHEAFYKYEPRANKYDMYMKIKDWRAWESKDLPSEEIEKLFNFIRSWDYHFKGDVEKFKEKYRKIFDAINDLKNKNIIDINIRKYRSKIRRIFDEIADCTLTGRYESTDASKILHTILPNLFVMWDRNIRRGYLGNPNNKEGYYYAYKFLPIIQRNLISIIKSYINDHEKRDSKVAINVIQTKCDGKSPPKLIDEFNYMTYTMPEYFLEYLDVIRGDVQMRYLNLYKKLRQKLNHQKKWKIL